MRVIRLFAAIPALFVSFLLEGATVPITILHTTDLHAHLRPDVEGRGGFAELATLIAEQKKRATNALVLDAGDLVQGTPVSTAENQHEMGTHGLQFPAKREGQMRDYVIDWIKKRKVIE